GNVRRACYDSFSVGRNGSGVAVPFFKEIDHYGATDVGVKRTHNQDAFTVQKAPDRSHWEAVGHLFIVADGMGGHAVGEKASAKAVQEIPLTYVKHVHD